MEVLQRIFVDEHDRFYADHSTMKEFEEEKHKKYEAETYFQAASDVPMIDADRSSIGARAYWDFVRGLRHIQQLEPLDPNHTGVKAKPKDGNADLKLAKDAIKQRDRKAQWERLMSDRAAAVSTYRFQERLKFRAANFNAPADSANAPVKKAGICRPGLRKATVDYMMMPPEADFSLAGGATLAGLLLLYANTLYSQIRGVMKAPDSPLIYNDFVKMSSTDVLWLVFVTKEAFIITVPLIYMLVYGLVAVLCLILSPILAGYYYGMVKGKKQAEKGFTALVNTLKGVVAAQVLIIGSLFLNLSTSFRMVVMADQLIRRKANASVKDFGLVLTTVSNIVFDLVLVMMLSDDRVKIDATKQITSMCINLVNLMRVITAQHLVLHNLCDAFKDINEHRLSKFEFAYLLVKIQEQLLEDDIQYNFVEHFYTGEAVPLTPQVEKLLPDIIGGKDEDQDAIEAVMPNLPEALAKEFGHDGLGEYGPNHDYKGPIEKAKDLDKQLALFQKKAAVPATPAAGAAGAAAAPAAAAAPVKSGWFGKKTN